MSASQRVLKLVTWGLGPGALARPRQTALVVGGLLVLAALAWVLVVSPWKQGSPNRLPLPPANPAAEITRLLSRSGYGPGGSDVRVLWATPEYFSVTRQQALGAHYAVDKNLVFFVWENLHSGDLPQAMRPLLRVNGAATYAPAQIFVPADAVHHRFSVFTYTRHDAQGRPVVDARARSLEIFLPPVETKGAQSILDWALPIDYPSGVTLGSGSFTGASLLALFGGMLASMWPCLFQLTAYFIPSLAGISMSQAEQPGHPGLVRLHVMKTAGVFILGFMIVYTAAGAAAGFAAQSLSGASLFWVIGRPLSVAAGVVILFMALRVAVNARAPLVCKMPLPWGLAGRRPGYLGTMLLGLAFATGCTTCFGAALILGIVAYAGLAGTALSGALIMLAFSLGMAIPLLTGALAMAHVLSVLGRLENVAPWMALASSVIMVGFGVLLLSGRFMLASDVLFGALK